MAEWNGRNVHRMMEIGVVQKVAIPGYTLGQKQTPVPWWQGSWLFALGTPFSEKKLRAKSPTRQSLLPSLIQLSAEKCNPLLNHAWKSVL